MARKNKKITQDNNVVVYLRVSKADGDDKNGLEVQLRVIESYIERKGYALVKVCKDDGISGATPFSAREGLQEAFDICFNGQASRIIAYHQDRFARKVGVFEDIREVAQRYGITLETADNRILTDKDDEIQGDVIAFVASMERKRIAERFKASKRNRAIKDGWGSSTLPFGYTTDENGAIVIEPNEAHTIRMVLKIRSYRSIRSTVDFLNTNEDFKSLKTPNGGKWHIATIQRIEANKELYTKGIKRWDDVVATEQWPIIVNEV